MLDPNDEIYEGAGVKFDVGIPRNMSNEFIFLSLIDIFDSLVSTCIENPQQCIEFIDKRL